MNVDFVICKSAYDKSAGLKFWYIKKVVAMMWISIMVVLPCHKTLAGLNLAL